MAQQEHDIEFRTKLWVAESFCNKAGKTNRGMNRVFPDSNIMYVFQGLGKITCFLEEIVQGCPFRP